MISEKALQEFKEIFHAEKGRELSDAEAMEEGIALLTLYNVVYRPVKREWLEEYFEQHPEDKNDYKQHAPERSTV